MRKFALVLLLVFASPGYAAINGYSAHSRANCINNESISWWLGHSFWSDIIANHYFNGRFVHMKDTGKQYTWRNGVVHWGEGTNTKLWGVMSYHYLPNNNGQYVLHDKRPATDCNIYDGWWDYK